MCERERERELGLISDVGRSALFTVHVYPGSGGPLVLSAGGNMLIFLALK